MYTSKQRSAWIIIIVLLVSLFATPLPADSGSPSNGITTHVNNKAKNFIAPPYSGLPSGAALKNLHTSNIPYISYSTVMSNKKGLPTKKNYVTSATYTKNGRLKNYTITIQHLHKSVITSYTIQPNPHHKKHYQEVITHQTIQQQNPTAGTLPAPGW